MHGFHARDGSGPRVKKLMLEGCVQEGIELRRASGYRQLPIAWETSFKLGLKLSYSDNGTKGEILLAIDLHLISDESQDCHSAGAYCYA